jgi:signal transduction histidine kinase
MKTLSQEKRASFVAGVLSMGADGGTVLAVRSGGHSIDQTRRDELLSAVREGRHVEVELDVHAFEQKDGAPNRKHMRFRHGAFSGLARTAAGMPFLRDHDQNNALARAGTIIEARAEKLAEGHYVIRESVRLSRLIDPVLDFSKIGRGVDVYEFADDQNLAEVVGRALDISRHRLERAEMALAASLEGDLPSMRIDANAITVAVLNLVDNANKNAADGKNHYFALRRDDAAGTRRRRRGRGRCCAVPRRARRGSRRDGSGRGPLTADSQARAYLIRE